MSRPRFLCGRAALFAALGSLVFSSIVAPAQARQLFGNVPPAVIVADVPHVAYRDLGAAPPSTPVAIALVLNYHHAEQLDQLITLQSDATSPYYRHWLSPQEFANAFAPTGDEYARAVTSLQRAGFRITQTYSDRTIVDAEGSVATAERYFNTLIDRVIQPGYGLRYANVTRAYAPPDLRDLVFAVNGLQNLSLVHTHFRRVVPGHAWPLLRNYAASSARLFGPVSSATGLFGYSPRAFAIGYDAPSQHNVKDDGTGRSAGIVIDADYSDSDLKAFLSYFNIKRTGPATERVTVDGGPDRRYVDADATEATLDTETLVGISPGVKLYLYEIPQFASVANPEKNITDAYNRAVSDNLVDTLNSSFGLCEMTDAQASLAWDHVAAQGAALGMTFHASTGDVGSYACGNGGGVAAPASSPHFVGVGGTGLLLSTTGVYQGEIGWDASGGGFSAEFGEPAFQHGVKNVKPLGRNLPDVSFDANPDTGIALYYGGTWNNVDDPLGGTSLASPIFGALLDQIAEVEGGRLGLVDTKLYAIASAGYTQSNRVAFHDVIMGSNGLYVAGIGYDNVTGIGSFDAWNLAQLMGKH